MSIADRIQTLRKSRGISQEEPKSKLDARIFALAGTAINFIGLVVAIMIWVGEQTLGSVAVS